MGGDRAEIKKRVRAAWCYSGLSQPELAKRTGINRRTLGGYLSLSKPNIPDLEQRQAIAAATGVPPVFMEEGFSTNGSDLEGRIDAAGVLLSLLLEESGLAGRLSEDDARAFQRVLGTKG